MNTVYFICDWGKKPRARLSYDYEPTGLEVGEVRWRGKPITVKLISVKKFEINKQKEPTSDIYALLKSNLQKQVRRRKPGAVSTAAKMFDLGQFELLRRLAIIAAEDVEVSTETAVIVWLMAAKSKGFVLSDDHKRWVLGYVDALVNYPICKRLEIRMDKYDPALDPIAVLDSEHKDAEQVAAILFRVAYGGLKGDPPMLSRCLDYVLQSKTRLVTSGVKRWVKELPQLLINRAAVDQHIWAGVVDELLVDHPHYDPEYLKLVLWECSSGRNKRHLNNCKPEWIECWQKIKLDFRRLMRGYLEPKLIHLEN